MDRQGTFPKSDITFELLRPLIGNGVFGQPGGDQVREARKLFTRTLARVAPAHIDAVTTELTNRYIDEWLASAEPVGVSTEMSRLTIDVVSLCTLGACFTEAESRRFCDLFLTYHLRAKPAVLLLSRNDPDIHRRIVKEFNLDPIGREMRAMVQTRFVEPVLRDPGAFADAPFIANLAAAGRLTRENAAQILDEIAVMLLAGHETTASTLAWLVYEMARKPEFQSRAAAAQAGEGPSELLSALTNEALRLYPPIAFFLRETTQQMSLRQTALDPKSIVVVSPMTLQRHQSYWSDPDEFLPDRWLRGETPEDRTAFMPFGLGARVCPGARFADVEMAAIVRTIVSRLRWTFVSRRTPKPLGNLTSRPHPEIYARFFAAADATLHHDRFPLDGD